ncbi:amp dependent CoA ligase [Paraphaeosphaeria sporulosa]|uniref:Amp dependent CoA ligase n=1 Tax=Paraphaeosphaeria sporulosa TaxID=1460663 RepID=A0A177CVH7_9PLEO|nr:amp dependent CoA ligase [Paraphaeosphaeria sporulosa]OAG10739.1 amp dependent CoA ligase [Paraphaeosphaeria sporulosa]
MLSNLAASAPASILQSNVHSTTMHSPKIYTSPYPAPVVPPNLSVSQLLQLYNPDDVEGDKVICEDDWTGKRITYAGIRVDSARGAYALRNYVGVNEGDVVCICAPNSVDVVKLIHAVLWCGGIAVLINPLSTEYEVAHCLEVSQPKVLAADSDTWPTLYGAAKRQDLTRLPTISLHGAQSPFDESCSADSLFDQKASLPAFDLSQRDGREHTAVVCFSSGTSGKAKGVELSHYNLIASMLGVRATEPNYWSASIRGVFFAPLCHIYGLVTVALMGTWVGLYTMLQKKYTLPSYLELSARIKATALRILPTIAVQISKQTSFDLSRLHSVKYIMCTGAVLPTPTIQHFRRHLPNAPVFQGYGMTETNITMLKPESAHRVGSVGKLCAGIEARIVDDEGRDVEDGAQGEMLVRGPSVFRRYMRNVGATRETFDGAWMRTGDVVRVDKEGYWWLTERKKELIKYKGNQVPPAELEAHLNSHPCVSEGAVCALWDDAQGTEVPIAYVALTAEAKASKQDRDAMVEDIRQHVDSRVAAYKKLRGGVVVLDEIPKSGNGKVLRRMLPARLARERKGRL